ncbi:hypothetical protein HD597_004591 [Nonomuraea thailandensis]|uniref:Uncharacterized protein n=1 Tax=Nonomuraea thailandensis TaxID=1188745 RepID=A0A9X2GL65_9ACTN|nr:hypothetical protein [Nonomuraea thailandensis]MCP2357571.1 hypothetical protein [Nonomuraea thailandensis]
MIALPGSGRSGVPACSPAADPSVTSKARPELLGLAGVAVWAGAGGC